MTVSPPQVQMYPLAVDQALQGGLDVLGTDVFAVLLDDGYTFDPAHEFLSSIGSGHRIATSPALTSKAVAGGALTADPTTCAAVAEGSTVSAWAVYLDGGSDAARRLLGYCSKNADTSILNIDTNGGDITLAFYPDGRVLKL